MKKEYKKKIYALLIELRAEVLRQNTTDQIKTYQFIETYLESCKKAMAGEIYREFIN